MTERWVAGSSLPRYRERSERPRHGVTARKRRIVRAMPEVDQVASAVMAHARDRTPRWAFSFETPPDPLGVQSRFEELDGTLSLQGSRLFGQVHAREAALAQQADDPVPARRALGTHVGESHRRRIWTMVQWRGGKQLRPISSASDRAKLLTDGRKCRHLYTWLRPNVTGY